MSFYDKLLLSKRVIIETLNDELKNIAQGGTLLYIATHTVPFCSRHRSFDNFIVIQFCILLLSKEAVHQCYENN